ncbi:hypothetical protein LEMLEM_LOCUS15771 [Lemmus lemmus]
MHLFILAGGKEIAGLTQLNVWSGRTEN